MFKNTFISLIVLLIAYQIFVQGVVSFSNPNPNLKIESLIFLLKKAIIHLQTFKNKDLKTRYSLHSKYYKDKVPYFHYRNSFGLIFPEVAEAIQNGHISGAPQKQSNNIEEKNENQFPPFGFIPSAVWKEVIKKIYINSDHDKAQIEHVQSHLFHLSGLFGQTPLDSGQREDWKLENGEWVLNRDSLELHISGSPNKLLIGFSEIDYPRALEDIRLLAKKELNQNPIKKGVELFEIYLKLDILKHYNQIPDIPDAVHKMKKKVLEDRLHELENLSVQFPNTKEVEIDLLRARSLLEIIP